MITSAQNLPIPSVPICDPNTGIINREWWRWFSQVFVAQRNVGTEMGIALTSPVLPEPPVSDRQTVTRVLSREVPADPPVTDKQMVTRVLSREVPVDPPSSVSQGVFKAGIMTVPPDTPDPKQAIFRSMMFKVPGL